MSKQSCERPYQRELEMRATYQLPFQDSLLVDSAAQAIIEKSALLEGNINLSYPHRFTEREQSSIFAQLNRRGQSRLIGRTLFFERDVVHEGKKVPGTVIHVEKKSRR